MIRVRLSSSSPGLGVPARGQPGRRWQAASLSESATPPPARAPGVTSHGLLAAAALRHGTVTSLARRPDSPEYARRPPRPGDPDSENDIPAARAGPVDQSGPLAAWHGHLARVSVTGPCQCGLGGPAVAAAAAVTARRAGVQSRSLASQA